MNDRQCIVVAIAPLLALVLSGCGHLVPSFYGVGDEGRVEERIFEGDWYMPDENQSYSFQYEDNGLLEVTMHDADDDEDVDFQVNIVEHDGQYLFDAMANAGADGSLLMSMHIVGRLVPYDECWCFETLGGAGAYLVLEDAGMTLLDRDNRLMSLREQIEHPQAEKEPAENLDPIEQMKASLESLHLESVEGVLLASQPGDIRAFLTLDEHFPAVYVPLMFCPGEPPMDDGGFDEDAFGELHPAAWTRLEDHEG